MSKPGPYQEPSRVSAERGEVILDGPNGVALSLTPDAADETARRLGKAAGQARTQLRTSAEAHK